MLNSVEVTVSLLSGTWVHQLCSVTSLWITQVCKNFFKLMSFFSMTLNLIVTLTVTIVLVLMVVIVMVRVIKDININDNSTIITLTDLET